MCLSQIHVFFSVEGLQKKTPRVTTLNAAIQVVQWIKWNRCLRFLLSGQLELGTFRRRVAELFFKMGTIIFQTPMFYFIFRTINTEAIISILAFKIRAN